MTSPISNLRLDLIDSLATGDQFSPTDDDSERVDALLAGTLKLPPHPEWRLPTSYTWTEDPFSQPNWMCQFFGLRWIDPLRREWRGGNLQAKELWWQVVDSWMRANSPEQPLTRWTWVDMVDGLRAKVLAFGLEMFTDSPEKQTQIVDSLQQHIRWLSDRNNHGHGNHALHQFEGLLVSSSIIGDQTGVATALELIREHFDTAYDADGINNEGAVGYHKLNFMWWRSLFEKVETVTGEDLRPGNWENLVADALAHATKPDGLFERIGDTDGGNARDAKMPQTEYVTSIGRRGTPPERRLRVYDGYIFGRSGWGTADRPYNEHTFYSLMYGSQKKIHGHQDGGSPTYFANKDAWLIDPGKYGYVSEPMRWYVVGRKGHNKVLVDGVDYAPKRVPLKEHVESPDYDFFRFSDPSFAGVNIQRDVLFSRRGEYLFIMDTLTSRTEFTAEQRWHLAPQIEAVRKDLGFTLTSQKTGNIGHIHWFGRVDKLQHFYGSEKPFEGWTASGWRRKAPAPVVTATKRGKKVIYYTLIDANSGTNYAYAVQDATAVDNLNIRIKNQLSDDLLHIRPQGLSLRS